MAEDAVTAGDVTAGNDADLMPPSSPSDEDVAISDLLVEEVSIDGMCGVY